MSPKADAYQKITDKVIEAMEAGHVPWQKPWRSVQGEWPTSLQTGKAYRGINVWILSVESMLKGYQSPYWVTFKQAKERGGNVRKGEKATEVVLWKPISKEIENDEGDKEEKTFLLMRSFPVFNLDQTEGIEMPEAEPLPTLDPIEAAESIVVGYLDGPSIDSNGGNRAYYVPSLDAVRMPKMGQFNSSELYYHTLFHELGHSTGHDSRLKRNLALMGKEDYSKEELVAEMTAAYLSGEAGLEVEVEHTAGYLQSWLKVLKDDKKFIVSAAAQAQRASDRILGVSSEKDED